MLLACFQRPFIIFIVKYMCAYLFQYFIKRERECVQAAGRGDLKQDPCLVQSGQGSTSQPCDRDLSQNPESDTEPTEPPGCPCLYTFYNRNIIKWLLREGETTYGKKDVGNLVHSPLFIQRHSPSNISQLPVMAEQTLLNKSALYFSVRSSIFLCYDIIYDTGTLKQKAEDSANKGQSSCAPKLEGVTVCQ